VVAEPGVATQVRTCFRRHACFKKRFPSSSLRVSNSRDARYGSNSAKWSFEKRRCQSCQPSSSFFTVLPEGFCCRGNRYENVRFVYPRLASNWQSVVVAEYFEYLSHHISLVLSAVFRCMWSLFLGSQSSDHQETSLLRTMIVCL
jgi:hypothetical protein